MRNDFISETKYNLNRFLQVNNISNKYMNKQFEGFFQEYIGVLSVMKH